MKTLRHLLVTAALVSFAGCAHDELSQNELPQFGVLQYESDTFEVWTSEGLEACGGTYDFTEGWFAAFRSRIGGYASGQRHTFYWLDSEDFEDAPCAPPFRACAFSRSNVAYSVLIPFEHEFVHLELGLRSQPPSTLLEGAAEVFGSIDSLDVLETGSLDILLESDSPPGDGYETFGRFSRFLIERFGMDGYFALYQSLDGQEGRDALAAGVRDVLGVEFSALLAEFDTQNCTTDAWRFYDYECADVPLVAWENDTRWAEAIELSCERDDVLGPRGANPDSEFVWTLRAFEVAGDAGGPYRLSIDSTDSTAAARIFECARTCADNFGQSALVRKASVAGGGTSTVLALDPGRYWMKIEHSADTGASVRVAIEK